jgi:Ca2+-binding EF-hand superfamily protein
MMAEKQQQNAVAPFKVGQEVLVRDRGEEWRKGVVKTLQPELRAKVCGGRYAYMWDQMQPHVGLSSIRFTEKLFHPGEELRRIKIERARSKWVFELFANNAKNLKQIFNQIDTDRSGSISQNEMLRYFQKTGKSSLIKDCLHLFKEIDANNDGELSYEELAAWLKITHRAAVAEKREQDQMQSIERAASATSHQEFSKGLHCFPKKSCGAAWGKGATWHRTSAFTEIGGLEWLSPAEDRGALRTKLKLFLRTHTLSEIFGRCDSLSITGFTRALDKRGLMYVYNDLKTLLDHMDLNHDGIITVTELEDYLDIVMKPTNQFVSPTSDSKNKKKNWNTYYHPSLVAVDKERADLLSQPVHAWRRSQQADIRRTGALERVKEKEHQDRIAKRRARDKRRNFRAKKTTVVKLGSSDRPRAAILAAVPAADADALSKTAAEAQTELRRNQKASCRRMSYGYMS